MRMWNVENAEGYWEHYLKMLWAGLEVGLTLELGLGLGLDLDKMSSCMLVCCCCCCVLLLVQSELDNVDEHRAESDGCSSVVFLDPLY